LENAPPLPCLTPDNIVRGLGQETKPVKKVWTILGCTLLASMGGLKAEDVVISTNAPSTADLGWTVESEIALPSREVIRNVWVEGDHGVIVQFLEAPNPLAPINPLAPPPPRFKNGTLSRDTVTGRVMGLTLLRVDF
jgi:hypothetical protein